ncbi:MAG: L,D-transpeptidase family protein [Pseudomonadota bacterium]
MTPLDLVVGAWGCRFMGRSFPCSLGKGGRTQKKREGDGATPIGTHGIVGLLYRPDRIPKPVPWAVPIRPGDLWSDDVTDEHYNHMVRTPYQFSHERLSRADPLYDLILLTNWNWPYAVKGRGSAIFIHAWRKPRHPTEGCVAFRPDHLLWITQRIQPGTKVIVHP